MLKLDSEKLNFQVKVINEELKNGLVIFQVFKNDEALPVRSKEMPYYLTFYANCLLTRKTRLIVGQHRWSIVHYKSMKVEFLSATFNNLAITSYEIDNTYLNATNYESSMSLYTNNSLEFNIRVIIISLSEHCVY